MKKKIAVIVVGSHFSGKSRTISKYLKHLLGMAKRQRIALWNGFNIYIKSQSLEESDSSIDNWILKWQEFEILVIACRPENEMKSYLQLIKNKLQIVGFTIYEVHISKTNYNEDYYQNKAQEIKAHFSN